MPSFQTTIELPIEVEYEYSAGQEPSRDEPGWAAEVNVQSTVILCPALPTPAALRFRKLDRAERRRLEAEALAHANADEAGAILHAALDRRLSASR